jgi:hypothetical protein
VENSIFSSKPARRLAQDVAGKYNVKPDATLQFTLSNLQHLDEA